MGGELTGLRARRVEPLRGRIDVVEAVTEVDGEMVFGPPKAHQHRSVVVPRFLREDLRRKLTAKAPTDLVFASRAGTPRPVQKFRRDWFEKAADDAGLSGLTPHELRHTAAFLAIASGASVKGVQSLLGHASVQMTLDRYGPPVPRRAGRGRRPLGCRSC